MNSLKKCVFIANNRSGKRHALQNFASTLTGYMNRAGIVHHDVHIPNDDLKEQLMRTLPQAEALVLCGGDGTVNRVLNLIAEMSSFRKGSGASGPSPSLLEAVPLLLVPTGLHNSIATSLGVTSAERAVSSLVVGRTVRVPLWAVHLQHPHTSSSVYPVRYMCSYVAIGAYAVAVQRQSRWRKAEEEYVSLPTAFGCFASMALYSAIEHASPNSTAVLNRVSTAKGVDSSSSVGPLRLLVASQMPQLQPGYSLTPTATYHRQQLAVTTATAEATRMRMWHLLYREARDGHILAEDGVMMHEGVHDLRIDFRVVPQPTVTAPYWTPLLDDDKSEKTLDSVLLVVDGECVQVPAGSSITVTPTELSVQFIVV